MASKVGNSLLIRTGVVFAAILAVTGFATGVIPVKCLVGKACAPQAETATVQTAALTEPAPAPNAASVLPSAENVSAASAEASAPAVVQVADVEPPKPTLTRNDVIASTFALLPAELQKPALDAGSARPKPLTASSTAPASGDLKTRKVRTVTVRADGTPMIADALVTQAYADPAAVPAKPSSPAIEAATRISAGEEPLPSQEPVAQDPPAKAAAAPAKKSADVKVASTGKTGKIAGSGSNVRAAPSKTGKVLFVLAAGESVKIGENSKGWLKVTDDKGRSGWVYKSFIN